MTQGFDPKAVIAAMSPMLGLAIAADHLPGVVQNLTAAEAAMQRMAGAMPDDRAEPAPVFYPGAME